MNKALLSISCMLLLAACKHEPPPTPSGYGNFPEAVGEIFITKCATAGCHNEESGGLKLDTWEHLFSGGAYGASVVAFSPDYSPLLYTINTDSSLGIVSKPQMPDQGPALSREEYLTIKDWIAKGAPDKDGNIPFGSNVDTRQKIYLTMGCDLIAVIDAETRTVMRYIKVGTDEGMPESPHNIKFSADGKYAYVLFINGKYLQKIDVASDQVIKTEDISYGAGTTSFNVMALSPDGSEMIVSDMGNNGLGSRVLLLNTTTMGITRIFNNDNIRNPHGLAANSSFDTFFVTGQTGNTIYRIAKSGKYTASISLNEYPATSTSSSTTPDPHDIIMSPDHSKYFVTCLNSREVRVMDARTDKLLKVIDVGMSPKDMAISTKAGKIFITCQREPSTAGSKYKGAVYYIDYTVPVEQYRAEAIHAKFSEPHGITVDDKNSLLYVASTNLSDIKGHHPSVCGGSNGYYQVFDLNTLKPLADNDKRYEVGFYPYSAATRFK